MFSNSTDKMINLLHEMSFTTHAIDTLVKNNKERHSSLLHLTNTHHVQYSKSSNQPRIPAGVLHHEGETQSDITHDH